jgi:uncharacterized protein HemX
MNDVVTWIALFAALSSSLGLLRFWQVHSDRLANALSTGATALKEAEGARATAFRESEDAKKIALKETDEVKKTAEVLNIQIAGVKADFASYREQAAKDAREYITRDTLREFEQRVATASRENADRLSGEIKEVGRRLDEVLLAVVPAIVPPTKRRRR